MNRIEGILRPFAAACVSGVVIYVIGTLFLYGERFSPDDGPLFLWLGVSMVLMGAIVDLPMLSCLQRRLGGRRPLFLFALIGGLLGPSLAYAIVLAWEKGDAAVVLNPHSGFSSAYLRSPEPCSGWSSRLSRAVVISSTNSVLW